MKVKMHTLGCKVNQYETQEITEQLLKAGFSITLFDDEADIFVVNSCSVTSESDRKTRQTVRHLRNINPNSIIVLTGCMPQAFPEMANNLSQADIVIGNKNNIELVSKLNTFINDKNRIFDVSQHKTNEEFCGDTIENFNERTRAIVKIEDGCDRFCSYCIIPKARGRVRSKSISDIISEVTALSENGFSEVVLVGINLSAYGKDSGEKFYNAVRAACSVPNIERVRLGSLEPDHITDEVIEELSKLPKLCPQFHISLQSGSDDTLKRMNRHYCAEEYYILTKKLRENFADCTITTDIMVGFPLESEDNFIETCEFVKKVGFEKVHIFPYSRRIGTKADLITPQIEKSVKELRAKVLSDIANSIRSDFLRSQIGKELDIILESNQDKEYSFGYTKNYIPVKVLNSKSEIGENITVLINDFDGENCIAQQVC
ncbi:MAG: tRNA (N(6)-L-threonylcarbamoyladenosine(37)-C(2))-methylthiotransferase MtaB [Oscillospiraceae bacterium]